MPLPEDVVADDPRYASEHPSHHNQIHAAINDLEALAGTLSDVETTSGSQGKVDIHALDTTSVHGVSDTAQLPFKNTAATWTAEQRLPSIVVKELPTDVRHPDFGGVDLTGVTDASVAVQAALTYGPEVYLPQGIYKVHDLSVVHWRHLVGAGMELTRLQAPAGENVFSVSTGAHNMTFEHIQFEGQSTPGETGFLMSGSPVDFQAWFSKCKFKNLTNAINLNSTTVQITGSEFRRCEFDNAPLRLINGGAKNTILFDKCRWSNLTQNVPAVEIDQTASSTDVLIQFMYCTWESVDRQAVRLDGTEDVLFDCCYWEVCNTDSVAGLPWVDLNGTCRFITFRRPYMADPTQTEVLIGTAGAETTFYGVTIEGLVLAAATGIVQRSKMPDLIELYSPVDGLSTFKGGAATGVTGETRWQISDTQLRSFYQSETEPRIYLHRLEGLALGDGASAVDTKLQRLGANLAGTASGDKFVANAGLGVGNSAAATTSVGALARKMEVFDAAGASLGFVPIYSTIS